MLADPRAEALADNFAGQWLELRNLDVVKPDPQKFPEWNPELREDMKTETRMFFTHILRENRPLVDFLDAPYTFLNERLAKFYGIPEVTGPDFRQVELKTPERGGILGHGSVLTVSSYPTRTSVVIRGKYILQNILNSPPPPPPPDVPQLDESSVGSHGFVAAADGEASRERHVRFMPQQNGPAGLRSRELQRDRQVADHGRQVPGGCERQAPQWQDVFDARRDARLAQDQASGSGPRHRREDADLLAGPRDSSRLTAAPWMRSRRIGRKPAIRSNR